MIKDDKKPSECTGLRLGTAAITTRGFDEDMCRSLGRCIAKILLRGDFQTEDGTIDFEDESIRSTLKKMIEKVGPFYKSSTQPQKDKPTIPDDLA